MKRLLQSNGDLFICRRIPSPAIFVVANLCTYCTLRAVQAHLHKVLGVEESLHEFGVRPAESAHGEVHTGRELAHSAETRVAALILSCMII